MKTDTPYPKKKITCTILAGGQGSRMGNHDKGLVKLAGQAIIEHVIQRVKPQVGNIIINANRHLEEYRHYGYPVVTDATDDFQGPLAGMAASLSHCDTNWMMTVPCDSPLLPSHLAEKLYRSLQMHDAELAVASDGDRLHPVFCLLSKHLITDLKEFLALGQRKIDLWFKRVNTVHTDFSDVAECFRNINTLDELNEVEQSLLK